MGKAAQNTRHIIEQLNQIIEMKPRLVLLMAGEPNFWNRYGLIKFLNERTSGPRYYATLMIALKDYFLELRSVRFFVLLLGIFNEPKIERRTFYFVPADHLENLGFRWLGLLYRTGSSFPLLQNKKEIDEARVSLKYIENKFGKKNQIISLLLARICRMQKCSTQEVLDWYEKSLLASEANGTFNFDAHDDLKEINEYQYHPKTMELLARSKKNMPSEKVLHLLAAIKSDKNDIPALLLETYRKKHKLELSEAIRALECIPGNPFLRYYVFKTLTIQNSFEQAGRITLKGAPFFDTYGRLLKAFEQKKDPNFYFSGDFGSQDNHLNSEGYQLIAKTLFEVLRSDPQLLSLLFVGR